MCDYVIPTEVEESCHYLMALQFTATRSLHFGRDDTHQRFPNSRDSLR